MKYRERNEKPMRITEIIAIGNFFVNVIMLLLDILKNKKQKDRS